MKLYSSPFSSNARKVLFTAAELGLAPEIVTVDLPKGGQRKPDYLALNPNGKVPVLVDGDFTLTESQAIMGYLVDKAESYALYPRDLRVRADVNRWMFWSANHWGVAISMVNWEKGVKRILGLGDPDPAVLAKADVLFKDLATTLDAHLAGREWLVGNDITLADISVGCPLMVAPMIGLPVAEYPNVAKWFERFQAREAWKKAADVASKPPA